eukprot:TRINITY_DN88_c1_g1_i2.p1 TRINITY_DN88_c1_g1~~TRINITY_DN88_c1_g1_i2.p1  ORF type:complete len:107 (-),score=5.23 TRINITY_DN88_c1_g1_i2:41-361(-)
MELLIKCFLLLRYHSRYLFHSLLALAVSISLLFPVHCFATCDVFVLGLCVRLRCKCWSSTDLSQYFIFPFNFVFDSFRRTHALGKEREEEDPPAVCLPRGEKVFIE